MNECLKEIKRLNQIIINMAESQLKDEKRRLNYHRMKLKGYSETPLSEPEIQQRIERSESSILGLQNVINYHTHEIRREFVSDTGKI